MSILQIINWADTTIQQGPEINLEKPLTTLDDFELAYLIRFHFDQLKRCELDLRTLDIWPETRSELFTEERINLDGNYHSEELERLRWEYERRVIP